MSTLIGWVGVPTIETMSPSPLRRSDTPASRMLPPATDEAFGVMLTRSAPAPLSVSGLVIVSAFVPGEPGPSAYAPLQMTIVSPATAASTAACTDVYAAAGQSALSSSTVSVAAYAPCAQHKTPALTSTGSNLYLKASVPLSPRARGARTLSDLPDNVGTGTWVEGFPR